MLFKLNWSWNWWLLGGSARVFIPITAHCSPPESLPKLIKLAAQLTMKFCDMRSSDALKFRRRSPQNRNICWIGSQFRSKKISLTKLKLKWGQCRRDVHRRTCREVFSLFCIKKMFFKFELRVQNTKFALHKTLQNRFSLNAQWEHKTINYITKKGLIRTLKVCINTRTLRCHHHSELANQNQQTCSNSWVRRSFWD